MQSKKFLLFAVPAVLFIALFRFLTVTVKVHETSAPGFTPFKDDALALKYAPVFRCPREYGVPTAVYYRASHDEKGNTHIAYHPVWERETNHAPGLMPLLSRMLYTGGLKLQRTMFGKGDVEAVGFMIDPKGVIVRIDYETAKDYDPKKFGVTHRDVSLTGRFAPPVTFRIISWNHLFDMVRPGTVITGKDDVDVKPAPAYFTRSLWEEYGMFKKHETRLKKNRAHFLYEREWVE